MVSHLTTHKALFLALPIALRNIKMPQHAKHQHHNTIINKREMPTLMLCGAPPLLKCAKKEEKTCNFCTFPVTNYFCFHNTYLLTPWQDATFLVWFWVLSSGEVVEAPPPPQVRGEVPPPPLVKTVPPALHHYKSKEPSVNTWLTHQWTQNLIWSTYHTFFPLSLTC